MKFNYKARTRDGKMETGTIDAYSKEAASLLLQKYNVFVTSLEPHARENAFLKKITPSPRIGKKDLAVFFKQLSIMLQSRVPVVASLASLAAQTPKKNFKTVIAEISTQVQEGAPLSAAISNYPKIFSPFYINLVKSGETSGNISASLNFIAGHLERENDIGVQFRQAMLYPIFVLSVLVVVVAIIIVEVMPRISDLVKQSGGQVSWFTAFILNFYAFLGSSWWAFSLAAVIVAAAIIFYANTKEGKNTLDSLALKVPFLGGVLKKVFLARFCSNVSTLVAAGVSINSALKITADTVDNAVYRRITSQMEQDILGGEKMSLVMAKHKNYFPPFVIQMARVGEETGKLDATLMEVVNFYQKDIKGAIDVFSALLEPTMIIVLGIIVAVLAISVLSPLYGALGTI